MKEKILKILLCGNGINFSLIKNSEKKYDLLSKYIRSFFLAISGRVFDFFQQYIQFLIGPSTKHGQLFLYYKKYGSDVDKMNDLETLVQLYLTSSKYELDKNIRAQYKEWHKNTKNSIINEIPSDSFSKEIVDKINNNYDLVITTNYDNNLIGSGIENVFHLHGSSKGKNINFKIFKNEKAFIDKIYEYGEKKFKNNNYDIEIYIYGINLFNETHILAASTSYYS